MQIDLVNAIHVMSALNEKQQDKPEKVKKIFIPPARQTKVFRLSGIDIEAVDKKTAKKILTLMLKDQQLGK